MSTTTPRVPEQRNTHGAAVITPTNSYWPNGVIRDTRSAGGTAPEAAVLDYAHRAMAKHTSVVFVGLGRPERADAAIKAAGWRTWHAGPWTRYTREGHTVALGYLAEMDTHQLGVLFDATTAPGVIADRLDRFGALIEYTWCGTPATTALGLLRLTWENAGGNPRWKLPCPVDKPGSGALIWERKPSAKESLVPAWSWDVNGMYLAAAGSAVVAFSELDHLGRRAAFDAKLPGYWLVDAPPRSPWEPPMVDDDAVDARGRAWLTTDLVQGIVQRHGPVVVHDSWTGAGFERARSSAPGARVFRRWAEILRAARTASAGTDLESAVKRTYAAAVGGMRRDSMEVFRPDWSHAIIDLARVNMLRRIWRVYDALGVWPVKVSTDEVTYHHPHPHLIEQHLGVNSTLGAFKPSGGWTA